MLYPAELRARRGGLSDRRASASIARLGRHHGNQQRQDRQAFLNQRLCLLRRGLTVNQFITLALGMKGAGFISETIPHPA